MLKDKAVIHLHSLHCSALLINWAEEKMADESLSYLRDMTLPTASVDSKCNLNCNSGA